MTRPTSRHWLYFAAWAAVLAAGSVSFGAAKITASIPSHAVIGLPLLIEYRIAGPMRFLHASPQTLSNPFPLHLKGKQQIIGYGEIKYYEIWLGTPSRMIVSDDQGHIFERYNKRHIPVLLQTLDQGESATTAVDLTLLTGRLDHRAFRLSLPRDAQQIHAGTYQLELSKEIPAKVVYDNRNIRLQTPNKAEMELLDNLRRQHAPNGWYKRLSTSPTIWELFVVQYPKIHHQVDIDEISDIGKRQLEYYLILSKLVHDKQPIAQLKVSGAAIKQALPAWRPSIHLL